MTAREMNCSTKCPLDGTRRTTLRELLEDYGPVRICLPGGSVGRVRIRLPGGSTLPMRIRLGDRTERVQYRIHLRVQNKGRSEEDRYWDTADRRNIAGEGITKKNPGAGIQDREDKVYLRGVRLCNQQGESPNKSNDQIRNPLITCRVTRKQDNIFTKVLERVLFYNTLSLCETDIRLMIIWHRFSGRY
jgi:hypothetical protein